MGSAVEFVPPFARAPARPLPTVLALWRLLDNPLEAWPQAVYEAPFYAPPRQLPNAHTQFVMHPPAIKHMLLDAVEDFPKGETFRRLLRPALGEGLLTAEGAHWKWQRQAAAPAFRHDRLLSFVPAMAQAGEDAAARLAKGGRIDVAHEMVHATFDVILATMFSGGEGLDIEKAGREVTAYLETMGRPNIADIFGWPRWAREALAPRGQAAGAYLRNEVARVVRDRRSQAHTRGDLVDLLLEARDPETGREMDDEALVDNLLTFIGAGHETTALTLTWALYLAGAHPATQARLVEEARTVLGDGPITAQNVEQLVFTRQVILEAMRLYPPVAVLPRTAARDVVLPGGCAVPKGALILMPIYALQRHGALWERPHVFDPDRFAPEKGLEKQRFQYMPFGAGPRICIGMGFALLEAAAILAAVIRKVEVRPDPTHRIRPLVRITMRPQGGMPMFVKARA
jgi:cytochrome P450